MKPGSLGITREKGICCILVIPVHVWTSVLILLRLCWVTHSKRMILQIKSQITGPSRTAGLSTMTKVKIRSQAEWSHKAFLLLTFNKSTFFLWTSYSKERQVGNAVRIWSWCANKVAYPSMILKNLVFQQE